MRWQGRRESTNIEDRRGRTPKALAGSGLGTIIVVLAIYLLGGDPSQIIDNTMVDNTATSTPYARTAEENELVLFVSVVLAETEEVWSTLFLQGGSTYQYPTLVLYSGAAQSACGYSGSATGPFYCPGDCKVYIALSFYDELQQQFKAPADFAMAYVIAHEVGHHVQTLLVIMDKVNSLRSRMSEEEFNQYQVRLELQAHFFAGRWAHYMERINLLEEGELDEALNAASAVGDDRIQKSMQGYVTPESFTLGTSEQRKHWFYKGFGTGDINQGDTFNTDVL